MKRNLEVTFFSSYKNYQKPKRYLGGKKSNEKAAFKSCGLLLSPTNNTETPNQEYFEKIDISEEDTK